MKKLLLCLALSLLCGSFVSPVQAQIVPIPTQMNFQGRIARPDGTPYFDGNYAARFSLWDAPTGGNEVWSEPREITLRNGVFSTVLGTGDPLTESVLAGDRWLEIRVETTTFTPRQKLLSNAFAIRANIANTVPDGSLTSAKFASGALNNLGWLLGGNSGTNPASNFLGTTDNQALVFKTNGSEGMRIAADGKVGIGTNTPAARLHVGGGSLQLDDGNELFFGDNGQIRSSDDNHRILFRRAENKMELREYGDLIFSPGSAGGETARVVMLSNGRVGIGTQAPASLLDVAGTAQMTGFQLPTGAGANRVLTSDASGIGTWQTVTSLLGANSITNSMIQSVDWSKIMNAPSGSSGWSLSGNAGTNPASNFLGTTDNQPLVFKVNNAERIRIGTIGNISIGDNNSASSYNATVGGGTGNRASGFFATVAGGETNSAISNFATVGGGSGNSASSVYAIVGGGFQNTASGGFAVVGGGLQNAASGSYAMVAGGFGNAAGGQFSFAAGRKAKANHDGSFVWGDSTDADFASSAANEFNIRASGGTRIFSSAAGSTGVLLAAGGGSWSSASDRNLKANFQNVDTLDVLEKLIAMPLTTWNYKANGSIKHLGPMAQDFYAAFGGLGMDDKHIDSVDADGVAFAAIQGLNKKLETKEKRLASLEEQNTELKKRQAATEAENAQLKARLEALEAAVQRLTAQPK